MLLLPCRCTELHLHHVHKALALRAKVTLWGTGWLAAAAAAPPAAARTGSCNRTLANVPEILSSRFPSLIFAGTVLLPLLLRLLRLLRLQRRARAGAALLESPWEPRSALPLVPQ